jgi:hypothetical protein
MVFRKIARQCAVLISRTRPGENHKTPKSKETKYKEICKKIKTAVLLNCIKNFENLPKPRGEILHLTTGC